MRKNFALSFFLLLGVSAAAPQKWEYARFYYERDYYGTFKGDKSKFIASYLSWSEKEKSISHDNHNSSNNADGLSDFVKDITGMDNTISFVGVEMYNYFGALGWEMASCHLIEDFSGTLYSIGQECFFKRPTN